MSHDDAVRARFGATAEGVAAHAREQIDAVREGLGAFLTPLRGDERVLDVGTGAGTLALALAPLVGEVVGIDLVPELLEAARRDAPGNVTFVEGDATALPFESFSFDLACSRRTSTTCSALRSRSRSSRGSRNAAGACSSTIRSRRRTRSRRSSSTARATARPIAPPHAVGRRLPRSLRRERSRARAQQALHAPAGARLLPRARRLHGKRRRAREEYLARRSRAVRRRVSPGTSARSVR